MHNTSRTRQLQRGDATAASDIDAVCDVKKSLSEKFRMKDMGDLTWFLGIEFRCTEDNIEMNQSKYVDCR